MTWSIVARDPVSGAFGVAAASKFFALGALVPWLKSGLGAVATQAFVNPMLGPNTLGLLEIGEDAESALEAAIAADPGRAARQCHVVDRCGGTAGYTGTECIDWCGHICAPGVSVAGNMLVDRVVVEHTLARYQADQALPFAERLLTALLAGDAAGGDKRGRQSAVLVTYSSEVYPDLSLRVDDHPDAPNELARIYAESQREYALFRQFIPTAENPAGVTDRNRLEEARRAWAARQED